MYKFRVIVTLLGLLFGACSTPEQVLKSKSKVVPIHVAEVEKFDVPLFVEAVGILLPGKTIEVRPQVEGRLIDIHFKEGQKVEKGDPLFSIDPTLYTFRIRELEADLKKDVAHLEGAKKKLERYQSLAKKDLIPQQEWDELLASVATQEAGILADRARLEAAMLDLERCSIKAPISGHVGKPTVDCDNLVNGSTTLLVRLLNKDELIVKFDLSEAEYLLLSQADYPIEVISLVDPGLVAKGKLSFIDHNFNADSGLLHVEGKIANEGLKFLPGQSVKVLIALSVLSDAKVIPQKAVRINQNGPYVYVVKDNKVELRSVVLSEEIADKVVVVEGVELGEKVVTDGHLRLSSGSEVEVVLL